MISIFILSFGTVRSFVHRTRHCRVHESNTQTIENLSDRVYHILVTDDLVVRILQSVWSVSTVCVCVCSSDDCRVFIDRHLHADVIRPVEKSSICVAYQLP